MTDSISTPGPDELGAGDNIVLTFQLEGLSVRGRYVRLGETMDKMLSAHDYPRSVARLVGECALVAILIGDSLKFDGRLIVQASGPGSQGQNIEGNGAVSFVVADFVPGEGVRAYAKFDPAEPPPGRHPLVHQPFWDVRSDTGGQVSSGYAVAENLRDRPCPWSASVGSAVQARTQGQQWCAEFARP